MSGRTHAQWPRRFVARGAALVAVVAVTIGAYLPAAQASGLPAPGGPGPLAFPGFSRQTFDTPPVSTRVKFRWWQPVADTNDKEIQREVKTMAANFGGGFEQNGFPVNMNAGGDTSQFQTYADSQQFGQVFGWGTPLWSHRTAVYQTAAAHDGVIGDMNEGSRWDNTAPTVYSPNQIADAQDLSYGVEQYQPGQNPSGELPVVTAPALGGESTTLTAQANSGDRNIQVQSVAGLLAGDQITLGQGSAAEQATIKSVGTPSPVVALSQPARAGSSVVHVAMPTTLLNGFGQPTSTTGVPGTAEAAAQFVRGQHVTIGPGADAEKDTIASIGTYDVATNMVPYIGSPTADWIWNTANSASSAPAGTIYLRKTFTTPPGVTDANLRINADDSEVTYVNGTQVASSTYPNWSVSENVDITKDLNPAGQTNVIAVAATQGSFSAGVIAALQIDGSSPQRIVTDTSWKAWPASTANPPVSATPPASNWNTVGFDDSAWENAFSTGAYGISPWGTQPDNGGGGPTTLLLPPGGSGTVAAPTGATNVEVASTTNFLKGDTITIGTGSTAESRTITSVGGSGSGTTVSAAANAGDLQISVATASGLAAGQFITIGAGSNQDVDRIATINGNTLTLYSRLQNPHAAGDPVALKSIGVTFTPALTNSHDVGESAIDSGTGITLKTPLSHDHPAGDNFIAPGTGVTLTAPLTKTHLVGPNDAVSTSLAAPAAADATNVEVASATDLVAGDKLTIGQPGHTETVTIQNVGTAGATSTEVTFSPALTNSHYNGDPVIDATNASVNNASGGVSDIERESLVAAELVQCLPATVADSKVPPTTSLAVGAAAGSTTITAADASNLTVGDRVTVGASGTAETKTISSISGSTVTLTSALGNAYASGVSVWDTCTSAPSGGTRELDPATTIDVTSQVKANALNFTEGSLRYGGGSLPTGNGQPWELIDFYLHGDTQTNAGATATTPNDWLGHLSVASAQAMADYFDKNILNNAATRSAIAYQDAHTGTPAVFEDSLENADNLNWVPDMISSWKADLGYNPTSLLPALAATGRNATETPAFDFPESDGHGATLGWRVRDDYGQMFNNLYINDYLKPLDRWASAHGLVARFQSYGDPIDEGEAAANEGIAETEHLETAGQDETQQFKVAASGTYQDTSPHFLSNECCEADGQAWADPFGIDGTGSGTSPDATENNAQSVYADMAGGDSQIVYHGWPYTIGAAGSAALWPGNTYGGDASFAAGNGPNQPQFADDRNNNVNVARRGLVLRQGQPSFDVAVFHEDFGFSGQGQDSVANGWNLGTAISGGVSRTPTSGKLIRSSSSLAQAGYLYGYVSPAFFRYPTAKFAVDPAERDQGDPSNANKVLFPGHGDYKSLVLYDQSVMPVNVARKIAALAGEGLPIVIIGQVPDAAPNASGGTLAGMRAADAQVRAALARVTASAHTKIVADATAPGSQSADANAPGALASLGITASTQMNNATGAGVVISYSASPTANWIWNTPNSDGNAASGTIYLRKTFTTPAGVTQAVLRINADDGHVTYVNGTQVASGSDWTTSQIVDITKDLNPAGQTNVIAVAATNVGVSPAGVLAALQIDGSSPQRIVTDTSWKAWPASTANPPVSATPPASNWNTVGFDDSTWENAFSAGAYGISPWGTTPDNTGATPVLGIRRHDSKSNTDYYQLFNPSATATVYPSVTLTGSGTPYLLNTWSGKITPIANYSASGDRVTLQLRLGPANADIIAISPTNLAGTGKPPALHATNTTANATAEGVDNVTYNSSGQLVARASTSGTYTTTLSNGKQVTGQIAVPTVSPSSTVSVIGGKPTLTSWKLSVDSWTQTPSGDPTQTLHTPIPASGTLPVSPLSDVSDGSLPSWTAITPQNIPGLDPADNLTNVAGIGTYTTSFALAADWSTRTAGAYLNVGAAVDTVDIWVNNKRVTGLDENDRNQIDIGPYLQAGANTLKLTVATPLRNAVAVAPATPATGQVPNSSETIGSLQGGAKIPNVGLMGPVTLTPYGQSAL
jgi:hypothetical protein